MDLFHKLSSILINIRTLFSRKDSHPTSLSRIPSNLFWVASLLYFFTIIQPHWNILSYFPYDPLPTFKETFNTLLISKVNYIIIGWLVYHFIFRIHLLRIVSDQYKTSLLTIQKVHTISDIIDLVASVFLIFYSSAELLYFANHAKLQSKRMLPFLFFIFYVLFTIIHLFYVANSTQPEKTRKQISDYFDANHRRIADGDYVLYRNKHYKVFAPSINSSEWVIKRKFGSSAYTVLPLKDIIEDNANSLVVIESSV